MWRLLYPLRYFSLVNAEKRLLDLSALPLAVLIAAAFWVFPGANFFAASGFLDKVLALTSALTGFYVAALVAAATFAHPDLDKIITVGPVLEPLGKGKDRILDPISRRQFACIVFGYLSFASLAMSFVIAVVVTTSVEAKSAIVSSKAAIILTGVAAPWIRASIVYFLILPLAHIVVVTGLGLYYLMERLHSREPKVLATKSDRKAA
jgi:hypothetical protein